MNRLQLLAATLALSSTGCAEAPGLTTAGATRLIDLVPSTNESYRARELDDLRSDGHVAAHVVLNGEGRPALAPPEPSRLSFAMELPESPELRFAIAAIPEGPAMAETEFRVSVRTPRAQKTVFRDVVGQGQVNRWLDRTVNLGPWSGSAVTVFLETKRLSAGGDVFTLWGNPVVASRAGARRPDLILVSIDCLRADHMGVYGYSRPTTPNLDRFAARSVVFEDAIASAPWTVPSHYTMFTGLPPSLHGVAAHPNAIWGGTAGLLSPSVPFLPEVLARSGYDVHAVVTSAPVSTKYGFHRGFATFRELSPNAASAVDASLKVLSRAVDREQFLFLHLIDPHAPYQPHVEFQDYARTYIERFGPRPKDISRLVKLVGDRKPPQRREEVQDVQRLYDATIAYVDEQLGRFLDELEHSGILDRAVVIVTADHGEAFYDHGVWQHGTTLYQDMLHIPMIVRWPVATPGRSRTLVGLADVAPTFVAAAGLPKISAEGQDLQGLLHVDERANPFATVSEVNLATPEGTRTMVSFRTDGMKYIATLEGAFDEIGNDPILAEELYDLSEDPGETTPLSIKNDRSVPKFRKLLISYLEKGRRLRRIWGKGESADPDEETLRKLRALGYVH